MANMGPIKSFPELQDSILKLRENFDSTILGRKKPLYSGGKLLEELSASADLLSNDLMDCEMIKKSNGGGQLSQSPMKSKDLLGEFGKNSDLDYCLLGQQRELECETDEEEEQSVVNATNSSDLLGIAAQSKQQ